MGLGHILFSFNGRIRRTAYWLASIGSGIVLGILAAILVVTAVGVGALQRGLSDSGQVGVFAGVAIVWLIPVFVVAFWISLALGIKRCHDRNYPGAMILLSLIPIFGGLWALIDLGFIDGTPGPNQYGPSPKGLGGAMAVSGSVAVS